MLIIQIALAIVLAYIIIISWPILIALIAGIIVICFLYSILTGRHEKSKEESDEEWRIWEEQREKEKTQKRQGEQKNLLARKEFAVSTPLRLME
jgi:H+/gluconate symporter-like permease